MAKNETKRLRPIQLQADQDALTAIQNLGDYKPANPTYGAEKLGTALSAMQTAQQESNHMPIASDNWLQNISSSMI